TSESGYHTHLRPKPAFDSDLEKRFAEAFTSQRNGWSLVREGSVLHRHQRLFFPDFTLRHEDGTEVYLEVVGFWTPEYLEHKREQIRVFREDRVLFAVCEKVIRSGEELPEDIVTFKTALKVPEVLEAAENQRREKRAALPEEERVALRDYQSACLETIGGAYKQGLRRQLVCLPTGTGKTVVFSEFPRFFKMKKKMLVLAHRSELLDQARDKILRTAPHLRVEVEQGGRSATLSADVVVASVPTLGRKSSKRLSRLDPDEFNLIIIDEAHHATAETYRRVLDHFGAFDPGSEKLVVGFTATPRRGDGQGLNEVFEEIIFSRTLPEMVEEGYLAPVAGMRVETEIDLRGIKSRMGDFVMSQLAESVNVQKRNDLVVDVYKKHLGGRKSICFTVDVSHAENLAKDFERQGIRAASVTGQMAKESRHRVLEDFRQGRLDVLTNCMVLTEGYDEPSVEGVILARPTRSTLLYTQMIGRGTRLHPGKDDVLVVDIVDVTKEHHLVTLPSLFGLSDEFDLEGRTTQEVQEALEWVEGHRPWVDVEAVHSLSELRYRCTHVNLLDLTTPDELLPISELAWSRVGRKRYRLGLPKGEALLVVSSIMGEWEVWRRHAHREVQIHRGTELAESIAWAEVQVNEQHHDELPLLLRDIPWRYKPASVKQRDLLESKKLALPDGITKGQASHLIGIMDILPR
ncbi:MAG: DEAD/DEAH box helicase, partial [Planctomycetota bacterium]